MPATSTIPGDSFIQHPISRASRVLLVNPPIYDYRVEWARWHHPLGLEQLGALLLQSGAEVKLVDSLAMRHARLARRKLGMQQIEGYEFVRWCFGLPPSSLKSDLRRLADWKPDAVMVTTLNSLWWQAAADTIQAIREVLPQTAIILGGMYPTHALEHAVTHSGADFVVTGHVPEALAVPTSYRLRMPAQRSTGILFYGGPSTAHGERSPRPAADIVNEIIGHARNGVCEAVFFDERIRPEDADAFHMLLQALAAAKPGVTLVLPGNLPPTLIDSPIARMLRPAGVRQVYLHCELELEDNRIRYIDDTTGYQRCMRLLTEVGGFRPRSGDVAAMLVVGLPFEDLATVSERLVRLAHVVGSALLVPFQFVPTLHTEAIFQRALSINGHLGLEEFNSKVFPLARISGHSLDEYLDLVRLAALVNSKHRSRTFDFLGDGLAARLLRESLRSQGWNPFSPSQTARSAGLPVIPCGVVKENRE